MQDITGDILPLAYDIILQCAFSLETNCQHPGQSEFVDLVQVINDEIAKRVMAFRSVLDLFDWYYLRQPYGKEFVQNCKAARAWGYQVVRDRRAAIAAGEQVPGDFLSSVLQMEDAHLFTEEQVVDQTMTFMAAGIFTPSRGFLLLVENRIDP